MESPDSIFGTGAFDLPGICSLNRWDQFTFSFAVDVMEIFELGNPMVSGCKGSLIVESRYARNYIPKFQAKFGVAEEETNRP